MSDSVRPHRRQHTRLPCPWDSLGKNTGVGCHFLLQCIEVKSESEVAQSCLTLCDPTDCSPPGSSIHGIFQARVLEWGAIAFSAIHISYYHLNHYSSCHHHCEDGHKQSLSSRSREGPPYVTWWQRLLLRKRSFYSMVVWIQFLPFLLCFLADIGKTDARILRFLRQAPSDGCKDQQTQKAGAVL